MKLHIIQNCPKVWYISINITIFKYFGEKSKKKKQPPQNPYTTPNLTSRAYATILTIIQSEEGF